MEALDALKSKESHLAFTGVLLGAMLLNKEEKGKWKEDAENTMQEADRKGKAMEETIIILKAKLIGMRDKALVEEMSEHLKTGL
jgi:hypothetical protein